MQTVCKAAPLLRDDNNVRCEPVANSSVVFRGRDDHHSGTDGVAKRDRILHQRTVNLYHCLWREGGAKPSLYMTGTRSFGHDGQRPFRRAPDGAARGMIHLTTS